MNRARAGALVVVLLLVFTAFSACGRTDPRDRAEYESDVALIKDLWAGFSDSWSAGREAGYAYVAAHNHPALDCSLGDYAAYIEQLPDPFAWRLDLYDSTIERDDEWVVSVPGGDELVPDGRVYVHRGRSTYTGDFPTETRENESHSAVIDGEAFFFFPCAGGPEPGS